MLGGGVSGKRTDPELLRQLDAAHESGDVVQAVVQLHREAGAVPVPAAVESQTHAAIDRAADATGERPTDVHVMGRMAVAYVSGSDTFIRELIGQPEVSAAVANRTAT